MIWSKDHIKRIKRAGTTLTVEDRHILWRHPLQLSSIKQSRQTGDKKVSPKFFTSTNSLSQCRENCRSKIHRSMGVAPDTILLLLLLTSLQSETKKGTFFFFLSSSLLFGHLLMCRVMTSLT
jgi:hypothetical protein